MSARTITIRTGSRLHLGPLSYRPERGRHFGGIGLAIDQPGVELTAHLQSDATQDNVTSERGGQLLEKIRAEYPQFQSTLKVDVSQEIPSHQGLGSGTQLGLAMAEAFLMLNDLPYVTQELAEISKRGERSAIGLWGYEQGGFLIDAGHVADAPLGDLACRVDFPEDWPILIVKPVSEAGLHGQQELTAFSQLPSMPMQTTGELCRLALTELLPAIRMKQFELFAKAVEEYGQIVGEFFGDCQGGIFSSQLIRQLVDELHTQNIYGIAQSSWGPAVAIFTANADHAAQVQQMITDHSQRTQASFDVLTTKARNVGRELIVGEQQAY